MKKWLAATAIAVFFQLAISNTALAEDGYQFSSVLLNTNRDRTDISAFGISYFFQRVIPDNKPLSVANFYSRRPHLDLLFANSEFDSGATTIDGVSFSINYTYVSRRHPYMLQLSYLKAENDLINNSILGSGDSNLYQIGIGYYITDNLLTTLSYQDTDTTVQHPNITDSHTSTQTYSFELTYIHPFADTSAFSIISGYEDSNTDRDIGPNSDTESYHIGLGYFFNRALGVGADYTRISSNSLLLEGDNYAVNVEYFFTPKIAFKLEYEEFANDANKDNDDNGVSVAVAFRF